MVASVWRGETVASGGKQNRWIVFLIFSFCEFTILEIHLYNQLQTLTDLWHG